jgi:hypothetical protein
MTTLEREDLFKGLWKISHNIDRATCAEIHGIGHLPDGKTSRRLKAVRAALSLARNIYDGRWDFARRHLMTLGSMVDDLAGKEPESPQTEGAAQIRGSER